MDERLRRVERLGLYSVWLVVLLFVLLLVVGAWPNWWKWIAPELSPMGWLESLLLVAVAALATGCAAASYLARGRQWWSWLPFAAAFLYLTLDERFALHERLRDLVLAPRQLYLPPFYWTAPGDFLLLFLLLLGLLAIPWLRFLFRLRPAAWYTLLAAIIVASMSVLLDSIDFHHMPLHLLQLEQGFEELLETTSMLLFLTATWLAFVRLVHGLLQEG
jgi:hypothetical protein